VREQIERCAQPLQRPMEVGDDEHQAVTARDTRRRELEALRACPASCGDALTLPKLFQPLTQQTADPSPEARWQEQLRTLARVERQHAEQVASAKGTQPQRLQE